MVQESLLYQFNNFFTPFLSIGTWSYLEMIVGIILFFMCLYCRVNDARFSSKNVRGFLRTKIVQFSLYLQMFISIFAIVDGYQIEITQNAPHIMLMIMIFSCICIKADMVTEVRILNMAIAKKIVDDALAKKIIDAEIAQKLLDKLG